MKKAILFSILLVLGGCANLNNHGVARYTVEPIVIGEEGDSANSVVVCCKVSVFNTKDVGKVHVELEKGANGSVKLVLDEETINATDPTTAAQLSQLRLIQALEAVAPSIIPPQ